MPHRTHQGAHHSTPHHSTGPQHTPAGDQQPHKYQRPDPEPGERHRWYRRILLFTAGLFTVVFLVVTVITGYDTYNLKHNGETATGIVDAVSHGSRSNWLEVTFETRDGQTVTDKTGRYHGDPRVGDRIKIIYNPAEPHTFQTANFGFGYWNTAFAVVLAVFCGWFTRRCWQNRIPAWVPRLR